MCVYFVVMFIFILLLWRFDLIFVLNDIRLILMVNKKIFLFIFVMVFNLVLELYILVFYFKVID